MTASTRHWLALLLAVSLVLAWGSNYSVLKAVMALVEHVMHVSVMTHAMHLSTPFSSALISACGPVFTLLIVRLVWGERFARVQVAGVLLALAGVLVFLSDKLAGPITQGLGDGLLLLAINAPWASPSGR